MKFKTKKNVAVTLLVLAATLAFMILFGAIMAEAKAPRNGKVTDKAGNIYIYKNGTMLTGWTWYKGKCYYLHESKSRLYPRGSAARNTYRVRNNRLYYFTDSGARLRKDSRYIGLNKASGTVHYIFAPGMGGRRYRYNANHKRYQYLNDAGRWVDTGMQCWPEGMIDWQW